MFIKAMSTGVNFYGGGGRESFSKVLSGLERKTKTNLPTTQTLAEKLAIVRSRLKTKVDRLSSLEIRTALKEFWPSSETLSSIAAGTKIIVADKGDWILPGRQPATLAYKRAEADAEQVSIVRSQEITDDDALIGYKFLAVEFGSELPNERKFIPVYRFPKDIWAPICTALLSATVDASIATPEVMERTRWSTMKILEGTMLCGGTPAGQMARLKACWQQAVSVASVPRNHDYLTVFEDVLGWSKCDVYSQVSLLDNEFIKMTPHSSAGNGPFQFDGQPHDREQMLFSDVVFASQLVASFHEGKFGENTDEQLDIINYVNDCSVTWLKNKFEAIDYAKLRTKTRNILVFTSSLQLPLGVFLTAFLGKQSHTALVGTSGKPSMSLMGFQPYYGEFHDLLVRITSIDQDKRFKVSFYSDNVFVYDQYDGTWYSLDAEKMEATSRVEDVDAFWPTLANLSGMDKGAVGNLIYAIMGPASHYTPFIFNDYMSVFPGLSSGSQGTFFVNHVRSAAQAKIISDYLNNNHPPVADWSAVDETAPFAHLGLSYSLKMTASSNPKKNNVSPLGCPSWSSMTSAYDHPGSLEEYGPIIRLDLLGYDATTISLDGDVYYLACLNFDRLMRAIVWRKTSGSEEKIEETHNYTSLVANVVDMTTMLALYQTGGYAYEVTHCLIRVIIGSLMTGFVMALNMTHGAESEQGAFRNGIKGAIVARFQALEMDDEAADEMVSRVCWTIQNYAKQSGEAVVPAALLPQYTPPLVGEDTPWDFFFTRSNVIQRYHLPTGLIVKAAIKSERREKRKMKGVPAPTTVMEEPSDEPASKMQRIE